MKQQLIALVALTLSTGLVPTAQAQTTKGQKQAKVDKSKPTKKGAKKVSEKATEPQLERAIFAGGCFWCMEPPFDNIEGVHKTISGYTGGKEVNPTYKDVSAGKTGHTEALEVHYDPKKVDYKRLVDVFWTTMDPTDAGGQFVDRGTQYRPAIYYLNDQQKAAAELSKIELMQREVFKKPIVVEITKAGPFYPAEDYHQDYYKKNPVRYKFYRFNSGRDKFLEEKWKSKKK